MSSEDAAACARRIRELYADDLIDAGGTLHVAAAWRGPAAPSGAPGRLITLTTGAAMPASLTDPFVLRVARARSDAILTTGRSLRAEPRLTHSLLSTRADTTSVPAWRTHVLGKVRLPDSVVLTRGAAVDFDHPLFGGPNDCFVFTALAAVERLRGAAARRRRVSPIRIVGVDAPDITSALAWLRAERRAQTICVEAGPSSAARLYTDPVGVDELMLSLCESETLEAAARGPDFLPIEVVERALPCTLSSVRVDEPSGPWTYVRMRRAATS